MKRISRQFVVACSTLIFLGSFLSAEGSFAWAAGQAATGGPGGQPATSAKSQAAVSRPVRRAEPVSSTASSPSAKGSGSNGSNTSNLSGGPGGNIAGIIRDASGTPQAGIEVELLRADLTTAALVFTDHNGGYSIGPVIPGQYALRAMGGSFITAMKPNLRIRANTVVNLTLNTLYDLMQWAPAPQRPRAQSDDDWAWTLRSPENRPLLRWQEDGAPVLVWSEPDSGSGRPVSSESGRGNSNHPALRARAAAGEKRFGSGAQQVSLAAQNSAGARRRMVLSADMSPERVFFAGGAPDAVIDAMMGFRQEMVDTGLGSSSVQTVVAFQSDPLAGAGEQQGLQSVSLRTWESLRLLDSLEAEAGSDQVLARLGSDSRLMAALPFAGLTLHRGRDSLEYRVSTAPEPAGFDDPQAGDGREAMASTWLPILSEGSGRLMLEHGLHQELGWSTEAGPAEFSVVIFSDRMENPVLQASGRLSAGDEAAQAMLQDEASGLLRAAGPGYSADGVVASVESRLPGHNRVKLSYAAGDALMLHSTGRTEDVATILRGVAPHHAQLYAVSLSGAADRTGTRWRAGYRTQPASAMTEVAPFTMDPNYPYLSAYLRQRLWMNKDGPGEIEAQLDLRNLLAQGYQAFLTSDGSHLYFAQAPRSVAGGLAFNF